MTALLKPKMRHSLLMLWRNRRSYLLLSVTVVLSFALLLGYLFYMDTTAYNTYKHIFAYNRGQISIGGHDYNKATMAREEALIQRLEGCTAERVLFTGLELDGIYIVTHDGRDWPTTLRPLIYTLPRETGTAAFSLFGALSGYEPIDLDGSPIDQLQLGSGQVMLEEQFYYAMGLEGQTTWNISGPNGMGGTFRRTLTIVGLLRSNGSGTRFDREIQQAVENTPAGSSLFCETLVLMSQQDCDPSVLNIQNWSSFLTLWADNPSQGAQIAEQYFEGQVFSVAEEQDAAALAMQTQKRTKALFTCAILVLLAINLYSSFSNALNDRKFEIGVKRAIGASAWEIIRQFLYESVAVMLVSTVLAVVLVVDVAIVYKFFYELRPNAYGYYPECVLYLSPYSVGMFLVCAVALMVAFSLIFAWRSTRVEIVQYLKAE